MTKTAPSRRPRGPGRLRRLERSGRGLRDAPLRAHKHGDQPRRLRPLRPQTAAGCPPAAPQLIAVALLDPATATRADQSPSRRSRAADSPRGKPNNAADSLVYSMRCLTTRSSQRPAGRYAKELAASASPKALQTSAGKPSEISPVARANSNHHASAKQPARDERQPPAPKARSNHCGTVITHNTALLGASQTHKTKHRQAQLKSGPALTLTKPPNATQRVALADPGAVQFRQDRHKKLATRRRPLPSSDSTPTPVTPSRSTPTRSHTPEQRRYCRDPRSPSTTIPAPTLRAQSSNHPTTTPRAPTDNRTRTRDDRHERNDLDREA